MESPLYALLNHWNFNDPSASAEKFRQLLEMETDAITQALIQTQLARTCSLQRSFNEAHALLDEVDVTVSPTVKALCMLERGRAYNSNGQKPEAVLQFSQALETATAAGEEYLAVDAAHMLAIADEPKKQIEWSERAMQMAEQSIDVRVRGWLGPLYNNLGWTYHDLGNLPRAMELFEKSLAWRIDRKDEKGTLIARWCIGRLHRTAGRITEALAVQRELEQLPNPSGYVFEEIGELLMLQNEVAKSKPYFQKAYDILSQDGWLQNYEAARLHRLKQLGE